MSLPKKKPRRQSDTMFAPRQAAPPKPGTPGAPSAGLRLFLERRSLPLAACLIGLAAVRLVWDVFGLRNQWAPVVAAGLVLWLVASGAAHHPDDQKRLAKRLRELGVRHVGFGWFGDNQSLWPELPATRKINPLEPAEGWTAVSPTRAKVRQYGLDSRYPNLPWFDYPQAKERVGTLLLSYVAPGSLRRQR